MRFGFPLCALLDGRHDGIQSLGAVKQAANHHIIAVLLVHADTGMVNQIMLNTD